MNTLGIDLAKLTFDATLLLMLTQRHHAQFPNTPDGFAQLHAWLLSHGVTDLHACMEATNVYWEALAAFLHGQGYTVSVVNPAQIKGFAQSQLLRSKTDKQDSATIALFCAQQSPRAWTPPSAAQYRLRALVRHREDLLQTRLQQQNRLRDTSDALVRGSLQLVLEAIESQIAAVGQQIKAHVAEHTELHGNQALLVSIVGIGTVTAVKVLAECAAMTQYERARAVAADAGLTPTHYVSGTSVHRRSRLSKVGNAGLRAALYWPAITAMRHCPAFKEFAARLAAKGKPKKVIICAVMRKLMHIIYGVLKHQTPYDPTKVLGHAPPQRTI